MCIIPFPIIKVTYIIIIDWQIIDLPILQTLYLFYIFTLQFHFFRNAFRIVNTFPKIHTSHSLYQDIQLVSFFHRRQFHNAFPFQSAQCCQFFTVQINLCPIVYFSYQQTLRFVTSFRQCGTIQNASPSLIIHLHRTNIIALFRLWQIIENRCYLSHGNSWDRNNRNCIWDFRKSFTFR